MQKVFGWDSKISKKIGTIEIFNDSPILFSAIIDLRLRELPGVTLVRAQEKEKVSQRTERIGKSIMLNGIGELVGLAEKLV